MSRLLRFFIFGFLLFPFAVLLWFTPTGKFSFSTETMSVFLFTGFQAALSAGASTLGGILGALGLVSLSRNNRLVRVLEAVVLVPNSVPILIVILAALNLYSGTRGLLGIVWVHALLNIGLVAIALSRLMITRLGRMTELAWIEGANRSVFFVRVVWPSLRADIARLFLFVFALCFSSFAVPLILGGSGATTVEVLIFEKIRDLDGAAALGLAMIQTISILVLSWGLSSNETPQRRGWGFRLPLLEWKPGLLFALFPSAIVLVGLLIQIPSAIQQIQNQELLTDLPNLLHHSIFVGVLTGVLTLLMLLALAWLRPCGVLRRFLLGYVAPSAVLAGFALLLAWRTEGWASFIKISLGLVMIGVPTLYRFQWDSILRSLSGQVTVALSMGASEYLIFRRVLLPQVWNGGCFLAGLAAFWAWGDFAVSSVVAERTLTVAMLARSLMGTYRLPAATLLVWVNLFGGVFTFLAFWGVGRVFGSRSHS